MQQRHTRSKCCRTITEYFLDGTFFFAARCSAHLFTSKREFERILTFGLFDAIGGQGCGIYVYRCTGNPPFWKAIQLAQNAASNGGFFMRWNSERTFEPPSIVQTKFLGKFRRSEARSPEMWMRKFFPITFMTTMKPAQMARKATYGSLPAVSFHRSQW